MKTKILMTVFSLFAVLSTFAQEKEGVQFKTAPLSELLTLSKEANKPIFLDVYAVWCGPCKYMSATVFPQKVAGDYFNKNFVSSKINGETEEGKAIMKKYGINSYPTFLILNDKGEELARIVGGAKTAEDFIKRVEEAIK